MTQSASPRPVLVTGGAGFIGSILVDRLLAEDRRVVVIDNLSTGALANLDHARRHHAGALEFHRLELVSDAITPVIEKADPALVYHCATTTSRQDPVGTARDVVVGTTNLLAACVAADVRKVVVASSAEAIHGQVDRDDLPIDEHAPLAPVTPAGAALASIEHWLHAWQVRHGLDWTVLALGTVYGPRAAGDGPHREVADLVASMLRGVDVTIRGDGSRTRDFVFVDDVVHAFALAADRGSARRYVIGTGRQTSINQLFRALAAATRFDLEPIRVPDDDADRVGHVALDSGLAARELGWKPWTTLQEGLVDTMEWWAASLM